MAVGCRDAPAPLLGRVHTFASPLAHGRVTSRALHPCILPSAAPPHHAPPQHAMPHDLPSFPRLGSILTCLVASCLEGLLGGLVVAARSACYKATCAERLGSGGRQQGKQGQQRQQGHQGLRGQRGQEDEGGGRDGLLTPLLAAVMEQVRKEAWGAGGPSRCWWCCNRGQSIDGVPRVIRVTIRVQLDHGVAKMIQCIEEDPSQRWCIVQFTPGCQLESEPCCACKLFCARSGDLAQFTGCSKGRGGTLPVWDRVD